MDLEMVTVLQRLKNERDETLKRLDGLNAAIYLIETTPGGEAVAEALVSNGYSYF